MHTFTCEWCKKEFEGRIHEGKPRRFCGHKCHLDWLKRDTFTTNCQECGKQYSVHAYLRNITKFCGISCSNTVKGRTSSKPWAHKIAKAHTGMKAPWMKEWNRLHPPKSGRENPLWKEKDQAYSTIHLQVDSLYKKSDTCDICGSNENLQWSNKDHTYILALEDWWTLCAKCHAEYDGFLNGEPILNEKPCIGCGETIFRSKKNTRDFVKKKYCSMSCYHKKQNPQLRG